VFFLGLGVLVSPTLLTLLSSRILVRIFPCALYTASLMSPLLSRHLRLHNGERLSDKPVATILRNCTQLTELGLTGCKRFRGVAFKTKKRPLYLQSLDLSHCELSRSGFKRLLKICSNLQSLRVCVGV
jgi:hypothetical protein